jgi:hypothetical protein
MAWSYSGVDEFGAWGGIAAGVQAAANSLGATSIQPTPRVRSKRNGGIGDPFSETGGGIPRPGKSFRVDGKEWNHSLEDFPGSQGFRLHWQDPR